MELEYIESGLPVSVPADTVILALGVRAQKNLADRFKAAFPDARVIGNAQGGGHIVDATQ